MRPMKKNSNPVYKIFLRGVWGGQCPNSNFTNFCNCPKRVELGMLQVNIDKANSRRYDVIRYMVGLYRVPSNDLQSAHQCTVYIVRSQVHVQMFSVEVTLCYLRGGGFRSPPMFFQNNYYRFQNYAPRFYVFLHR